MKWKQSQSNTALQWEYELVEMGYFSYKYLDTCPKLVSYLSARKLVRISLLVLHH